MYQATPDRAHSDGVHPGLRTGDLQGAGSSSHLVWPYCGDRYSKRCGWGLLVETQDLMQRNTPSRLSQREALGLQEMKNRESPQTGTTHYEKGKGTEMVEQVSAEEEEEIMSSGGYVCAECPGYVDISVDCGH